MIALLVAALGGLVTACLILSDDRAASASRSTASRSASAKNRMGDKLPTYPRVKAEIEQFFLSVTFFTDKRAKVTGWRGPKAAHKLVNASLTGGNT